MNNNKRKRKKAIKNSNYEDIFTEIIAYANK